LFSVVNPLLYSLSLATGRSSAVQSTTEWNCKYASNCILSYMYIKTNTCCKTYFGKLWFTIQRL